MIHLARYIINKKRIIYAKVSTILNESLGLKHHIPKMILNRKTINLIKRIIRKNMS